MRLFSEPLPVSIDNDEDRWINYELQIAAFIDFAISAFSFNFATITGGC